MGRIGRLLKSEIKKYIEHVVETRAGYNQSSFQYGASGEDSPPLPEERIILVSVDGTGKYVAVGVLTASQGAKPGEKIFYARRPDADIVSKISMLNDGSVGLEADGNISMLSKKNAGIRVGTGGKIALFNNLQSLASLIGEMIDEIKAIRTLGSPAKHRVNPATQAKFEALKVKIMQLLED